MPSPSIFGLRLKAARDNRGWTQGDLANASGVPSMMISHFETGVRPSASAATLVKLANALSVSIDYLLGRVETPAPVGGQVGVLLRSVEDASAATLNNLVAIAQTLAAQDRESTADKVAKRPKPAQ
jgi:transcriptional regulator with XRE-family HTH domain